MNASTRYLSSFVALSVVAGLAVPIASAGPLEKSRVPAGVAWIVHLDAEAALGSSIGRALLEGEHGKGHAEELAEVKAEFGIDLLHDIKGATVFGSDTEGDDAVAILTASAAVDAAIDKLRANGHEYTIVKEGGYDLYAWSDDGHTQFGLILPAGADRLVYLSKDKSRLAAAADVGAGKGENLRSRRDSLLASNPGAGAVLFIATDVIPRHHQGDQASMVLEKARAVRLEIGESGENCYGDLELKMASSEDATNVVQILQGLQAMARMFCQSNPDLAPLKELMDAESLSAKESSIMAQIRYPTAKLVEAIKAAEKEDEDGDDGDEDAGDHHKVKDGKGEHGKKPL